MSFSTQSPQKRLLLFDYGSPNNIKHFNSFITSLLTIYFLPRSPITPELRLRDLGIVHHTPHSYKVFCTFQRELGFPAPTQNLVPLHSGAIVLLEIKRNTWSDAGLENGLTSYPKAHTWEPTEALNMRKCSPLPTSQFPCLDASAEPPAASCPLKAQLPLPMALILRGLMWRKCEKPEATYILGEEI